MKIKITKNIFKYNLVKNYYHKPLLRKDYKKITNTSLIIVWRNTQSKEIKYLIQKRSKKMKNGKKKLAIGGGMLEDSDKTLQHGAIREILEESQVQLMKKDNLSVKAINSLIPYLFPLETDGSNFTFFLIINSKKEPKFLGPIKKTKKPFLDSSREIDLEDDEWKNKSLKGRIKHGHAFLTSKEILHHFTNSPKIWFWSKKSFLHLFPLLE